MCEKGLIRPLESSNWTTPLKADDKIPRICGDWQLTFNKKLLQQTCVTEEPEEIRYRLADSKTFSKIDLKDAYLHIPLAGASSFLTIIGTQFRLQRSNSISFGLLASPEIFTRSSVLLFPVFVVLILDRMQQWPLFSLRSYMILVYTFPRR